MTSRLANAVSLLARLATVEELARVCTGLRAGNLTATSSRRVVELVVGRRPALVDVFCALQDQWRTGGWAAETLALALESCGAMKGQFEEERNALELVWTGPRPHGSVVRATSEVMKQMVSHAQHSVILLGYAITGPGDLPSSAADILSLLVEVKRHSRDVTVVMHDTADNRRALVGAWAPGVPLPRVLTWGGDPSKPYASLHAKVLIVDADDLLITSANLTHHGMDANLELGVRIKGPFVDGVSKHLTLLEREGILYELGL
jgi:phosphatidylserine/phosphatidylglycerophosphate/cardiolipin synthase-like enzyme